MYGTLVILIPSIDFSMALPPPPPLLGLAGALKEEKEEEGVGNSSGGE